MVVSQEVANLRYQEYLAKKADPNSPENQLKKQEEQRRILIQQKVEDARNRQIHTAKKEYICQYCNHAIPVGTKYRRRNIIIGFGFPEGNHYETVISHVGCIGGKQ